MSFNTDVYTNKPKAVSTAWQNVLKYEVDMSTRVITVYVGYFNTQLDADAVDPSKVIHIDKFEIDYDVTIGSPSRTNFETELNTQVSTELVGLKAVIDAL